MLGQKPPRRSRFAQIARSILRGPKRNRSDQLAPRFICAIEREAQVLDELRRPLECQFGSVRWHLTDEAHALRDSAAIGSELRTYCFAILRIRILLANSSSASLNSATKPLGRGNFGELNPLATPLNHCDIAVREVEEFLNLQRGRQTLRNVGGDFGPDEVAQQHVRLKFTDVIPPVTSEARIRRRKR